MNRSEKFQYVVNHWFLQDGIVYSKRSGKPISFSRLDKDGYRNNNVHSGQRHCIIYEHEVVFMLHHNRPIADGMVIHHIDGNRLNNHPSNLVELTQKQHRRIHAYQCDDPLRGIYFTGNAWQISWYGDDGRRHHKRFHEINDAMLFRAELEEPRRAELRALGLDC